jgi:hypothetical protein
MWIDGTPAGCRDMVEVKWEFFLKWVVYKKARSEGCVSRLGVFYLSPNFPTKDDDLYVLDCAVCRSSDCHSLQHYLLGGVVIKGNRLSSIQIKTWAPSLGILWAIACIRSRVSGDSHIPLSTCHPGSVTWGLHGPCAITEAR